MGHWTKRTRALLGMGALAAALCSPTTADAQAILYCVDRVVGTDQMSAALGDFTAMVPGATVTRPATPDACAAELASGRYPLAIVFVQSSPPLGTLVTALQAHVTAGRRAIGADYRHDAAFASIFGVGAASGTNADTLLVSAPLDVLFWNPIMLTNPGWATFSVAARPGSGSVSLGTLGADAGIIRNASSTTLWNGFLSDTGDSNLRRLYRNELNFLAGPDADRDGFTALADCNDRDPSIHPRAVDNTCDGVDQNCSGVADEAYESLRTRCGVGACAASGSTTCVRGSVVDSCRPGAAARDDRSCDGVDNNCNGSVDEEYSARDTTCGVGACGRTGRLTCVSGRETDSCTPGAPARSDATCDGVDDNCNGRNDEEYASTTTACGVGVCAAAGATRCEAGRVLDSCVPGAPMTREDRTCDGVDQDCSGEADEDYVASETRCGVGACGALGALSCVRGEEVDSCMPRTAPSETDATCDGVDDDCSGTADEDFEATDTTCGVGACGATGRLTCVDGRTADSCTAGTPGLRELCNGLDDDCNGMTDEGMACTDAGADAGVVDLPDSGGSTLVDAGTADVGMVDAGSRVDSATRDGGGSGGAIDAGGGGASGGGCGCAVPARGRDGRSGLAVLLFGLGLAVRRRRR